jgi:hypothetical protein
MYAKTKGLVETTFINQSNLIKMEDLSSAPIYWYVATWEIRRVVYACVTLCTMFPSHFQKRVRTTCFGIFFLETFEIWTWKQKMCAVKHEIKDYKCMFLCQLAPHFPAHSSAFAFHTSSLLYKETLWSLYSRVTFSEKTLSFWL